MHKGWYKQLEENDDNGFAECGGYMEAKKAKLIKQVRQQASTDCQSLLFKGVAIFVNGHTKPSAEELKVLMGRHGGVYHIYQMPSTTHIIASNLPNVKINKLGPLPIVKPSWIEDSITLGRLLDYSNYLLYTNQNRAQPRINFLKENLEASHNISIATSSVFRNVAKTASDPSFLSEFYGNSRLHLIATLGAQFKQFVNELRSQKKKHNFTGLTQLLLMAKDEKKVERQETSFAEEGQEDNKMNVIMHIDMDCFFVSVGLRNHPQLKGKPVAVTHSKTGLGRSNVDRSIEIAMYKDRLPNGAEFRLLDIDDNSSLSEIASCSYEARQMGVKNGMFVGQALKICPDLRTIPYDFEGYKEVSKTLYETMAQYTLDIEAVSCDEMYVNITPILLQCRLTVNQFASHIRGVIKERTGCPCSTGFGSNRLQARVATKRAKPDGFFYLLPSEVVNYFNDLPVSDLPGVGRATLMKMKHLGLESCGDVQLLNMNTLQKEVGQKLGETIFEQAHGIDKKPLQYEHERKSVSAEVNYGIRFQSKQESLEFLKQLAKEVTSRLIEIEQKAKCVTLKLMVRAENAPKETAKFMGHGVCDSMSKSSTLQIATDDADVIFGESKTLYEKCSINFGELRGVGIQLSRMEKCSKVNSILKNFFTTTHQPKLDLKIANRTCENVNDSIPPSSKIFTTAIETGKKLKGRKINDNSQIKSFKKSSDLTNFFKSTQKDRSSKSTFSTVPYPTIKNLDLSVLKELPDYIQKEIIEEYNLQSEFTEPPSTSESIDNDISSNKDSILHRKLIEFESLSYEHFINMLSQWLETDAKPFQVDLEILGNYFKYMASQKKIEKLYIFIKYLHRNIANKLNCDWYHGYLTICDILQEGMVMSYKQKLKLPIYSVSYMKTLCKCDLRQ